MGYSAPVNHSLAFINKSLPIYFASLPTCHIFNHMLMLYYHQQDYNLFKWPDPSCTRQMNSMKHT